MKKHRSLIISSLATLIGITLAASVSGTVAWFQYATRATVAYTGTTAHCSKLLNISVDNGQTWKTDLKSSDLPQDITFPPITTGAQEKDEALTVENNKTRFYSSPDYRQGLYSNWLKAQEDNYLQFKALVKLADVDANYGTASETYLANDVYLTDLTIQNADQNDLAKAVRVHFDAESPDGTHKYFLFAKEDTSINVGGFLDINCDGELDTAGYEWSDLCIYGGTDGEPVIENDVVTNPLKQTAYLSNDDSVIATDTNGTITGGTSFGKTSATAGEYLSITVTVWLEGWSELQNGVDGDYHESDTSIWNSASYADKSFNVGMTFGVNIHSDADHE